MKSWVNLSAQLFLFTLLAIVEVFAENSTLKISVDDFGKVFGKLSYDLVTSLNFASAIPETSTDELSLTKTATNVVFPLFYLSPAIDIVNLTPVHIVRMKMSQATFDKRQAVVIDECISQLNKMLQAQFYEAYNNIPEVNPLELKLSDFLDNHPLSVTESVLNKCFVKSSYNDAKTLADVIYSKHHYLTTGSFEYLCELILQETLNNSGVTKILLSDIVTAYNDIFAYDNYCKCIASTSFHDSFNFTVDDFIPLAYFTTIKIKSFKANTKEILGELVKQYQIVREISNEELNTNAESCIDDFFEIITEQGKMNLFTDEMNGTLKYLPPRFIKLCEIPIDQFNDSLSSKFEFPVNFENLSQVEQKQCLGAYISNGNISVPLFNSKNDFFDYAREVTPAIRKHNSVMVASTVNSFFTEFFKQLLDAKRIKDFLLITTDDSITNTFVMPSNILNDSELEKKVKTFQQPVKTKVDKSMIFFFVSFMVILFIFVPVPIIYAFRVKNRYN